MSDRAEMLPGDSQYHPQHAKHEWFEVVPPRIYGGDVEPKMAVQCRNCGRQVMTTEADAKYLLATRCLGIPIADMDDSA